MDDFFGFFFAVWFAASTFGAINNMIAQTPDKRIITMCESKGYVNIGQTVISCSIEKGAK